MSTQAPDSSPATLIAGLMQPAAYPHPTGSIRVEETHISWIVLAGEYAYKVKKPVDFGFLDFSTLELRRFFCEEEVRLNRRYAPGQYLGVVAITGTPARPRVGGAGITLEYAVRMRRFDDARRFDRLVSAGQVSPAQIDRLAALLAGFQGRIARAGAEDPYGEPAVQARAVECNLEMLMAQAGEPGEREILQALLDWSRAAFEQIAPVLAARKHAGWVRECHGDLHLANIADLAGVPVPFDGIEFSPALRWIDVMSELAFLVMDLEAQGRTALAYRLLNRCLAANGDYAGLIVLDYFRVYRALVRAKIALIDRDRAGAAGTDDARDRYLRYRSYAQRLIAPRRARLLLMHGFSGSGKSHFASRLAELLPAIHLRSDVERPRLVGAGSSFAAERRYTTAVTAATYRRLEELAVTMLRAGHSVIVDATFLRRSQRQAFLEQAHAIGIDARILDCDAPFELMVERIRARRTAADDPSEADEAVLEWQRSRAEPLSEAERERTIRVGAGDLPLAAVLAELRRTG